MADPKICHGKPTFKGTRITVVQVQEQVACGTPWERIVWSWRGKVTMEAITEAVKVASHLLQDEGFFHSHVSEFRRVLRVFRVFCGPPCGSWLSSLEPALLGEADQNVGAPVPFQFSAFCFQFFALSFPSISRLPGRSAPPRRDWSSRRGRPGCWWGAIGSEPMIYCSEPAPDKQFSTVQPFQFSAFSFLLSAFPPISPPPGRIAPPRHGWSSRSGLREGWWGGIGKHDSGMAEGRATGAWAMGRFAWLTANGGCFLVREGNGN